MVTSFFGLNCNIYFIPMPCSLALDFFLHVEFYNNEKKIDMENISTLDSLQEW
jgi:hypothetical protein